MRTLTRGGGRVTSKEPARRRAGEAPGGGQRASRGPGKGRPGRAEQRRDTVRPGGPLCCCDGKGLQGVKTEACDALR